MNAIVAVFAKNEFVLASCHVPALVLSSHDILYNLTNVPFAWSGDVSAVQAPKMGGRGKTSHGNLGIPPLPVSVHFGDEATVADRLALHKFME